MEPTRRTRRTRWHGAPSTRGDAGDNEEDDYRERQLEGLPPRFYTEQGRHPQMGRISYGPVRGCQCCGGPADWAGCETCSQGPAQMCEIILRDGTQCDGVIENGNRDYNMKAATATDSTAGFQSASTAAVGPWKTLSTTLAAQHTNYDTLPLLGHGQACRKFEHARLRTVYARSHQQMRSVWPGQGLVRLQQ